MTWGVKGPTFPSGVRAEPAPLPMMPGLGDGHCAEFCFCSRPGPSTAQTSFPLEVKFISRPLEATVFSYPGCEPQVPSERRHPLPASTINVHFYT